MSDDASQGRDDLATSGDGVVVVGAGLGGLRVAEQLRHLGYGERITLLGDETHLPFDRPPLSKQLLAGVWQPDRLTLLSPDKISALDIDVRLGQRVCTLRAGEVETTDGRVFSARAVVIATGVVARRLPGQPRQVLSLRSIEDSLRLRSALDTARSLLIVGAGFVGAEVASTAVARGVQVTVLEASATPLDRVLGPEVGSLCARLMREAGVDLHTEARVTGFATSTSRQGSDGVEVALADGLTIAADVAVVGIGGAPEVAWLESLGIDLVDGIRCDDAGRVTGLHNVWALGDVAAWQDGSQRRRRREHWTSATDQALIVAHSIVGAGPPAAALPYVWSDQFGLKIQVLGRTDDPDRIVTLHGTGLSGGPVKGTVAGYLKEDRLAGVVGFGAPKVVTGYRPALRELGPDHRRQPVS